jgi:hypothetical protein
MWAAFARQKEMPNLFVGAPFQITRFDSPRREISPGIGRGDMSVSAKRLMLTIMEQTGGIWMLDNMTSDV